MTSAPLAPLPRLAPDQEMRGGDVTLVRDELKYLIAHAAITAPRSLQTRIGPSEVGTPCTRKLAYLVSETPRSAAPTIPAPPASPEATAIVRDAMRAAPAPLDSHASWRSVIGTAVHAWLADAFTEANAGHDPARWLAEMTVDVGEIAGKPVLGHADLYDRVTAGVIDWKIVGAGTLKSAKANGPAQGYRVQAHLYGRGFRRRGVPCDWVGIMYLPRNGEVRDAYMWSEPYDARIADTALQRADATATAMRVGGAERMLPVFPTYDDYCSSCSWYRPGVLVASPAGCPGHDRAVSAPLPPADDVLGAA